MTEISDLSDRHQEILRATVDAWNAGEPGPAHQPLHVSSTKIAVHENWPADVEPPSKRELQPLSAAKFLIADRSVAPDWSLSPSAATLDALAPAGAESITEALSDADRRLGLILEGTVAAYEADPSEPLHLAIMDSVSYVQAVGWPLPPNAAGRHDFELLEDEGLVRIHDRGLDIAVSPTPHGRGIVRNTANTLQQMIDDATDPAERSRLQRALDRVRAVDVGVNAGGGMLAGLALQALFGS